MLTLKEQNNTILNERLEYLEYEHNVLLRAIKTNSNKNEKNIIARKIAEIRKEIDAIKTKIVPNSQPRQEASESPVTTNKRMKRVEKTGDDVIYNEDSIKELIKKFEKKKFERNSEIYKINGENLENVSILSYSNHIIKSSIEILCEIAKTKESKEITVEDVKFVFNNFYKN